MTLLFSDDFSGTSLNPAKWRTDGQWAGASTPACQDNPHNVVVASGELQLVARAGVATCPKPGGYTQCIIQSGGWHDPTPFAFTYGYVEAVVKVPSGRGLWPAVWLYDVQGGNPEIDLGEWLCHDTKTVQQTVHYADGTYSTVAYTGPDWSTDYHVLGLNWQAGVLDWYVDGVLSRHLADPRVPSVPMYVLLNIAVGGSWPGMPDATTPFPAIFHVDRLAVYDKMPSTGSTSALQQQLVSTQAQVATLTSQLTTAQAQVSTLKDQLSSAAAQVATLSSQLASAEQRGGSLSGQVATLTGQLATAQQGLQDAQAQVGSLSAQLATAQTDASDARAAAQTLEQQVADLGARVAQYQQASAQLTHGLATLNALAAA